MEDIEDALNIDYGYVQLNYQTHCGKYQYTLAQMDTIKDADRTFRFDVQDIAKEWRITEMMCECMDLVKELEEMKRYGHASK
jgi:hypothetical protein